MKFFFARLVSILTLVVFFVVSSFGAITEVYPEYFLGTQLPSEVIASKKKEIDKLIEKKNYDSACRVVVDMLNYSMGQYEKSGDKELMRRETEYAASKFDFFVEHKSKSDDFSYFGLKLLAEFIMEAYIFCDPDGTFNFLYKSVFMINDPVLRYDLLEGFLSVARDYSLLKSAVPFAQGIFDQLFVSAERLDSTSWEDALGALAARYSFMHVLFYYKTFIDAQLAISYGQITTNLFFQTALSELEKIVCKHFDEIKDFCCNEISELKVELKKLKTTLECDESRGYLECDIAEVEDEIELAKKILSAEEKQAAMVFLDLFASSLTGFALDIVRTMQVQKEFESAKLYLKSFYRCLSSAGCSDAAEGLKQFINNVPKSWSELHHFADIYRVNLKCIPQDSDAPKIFLSTDGFDTIFAG